VGAGVEAGAAEGRDVCGNCGAAFGMGSGSGMGLVLA
jgi:hypothetical protein